MRGGERARQLWSERASLRLSLLFFDTLAFVSLFLLCFSFSQETHRPLLPIHFHHLINCGLATDYHRARQSCEALCRRRKQLPFWRGFSVASDHSVGIEAKLASVIYVKLNKGSIDQELLKSSLNYDLFNYSTLLQCMSSAEMLR